MLRASISIDFMSSFACFSSAGGAPAARLPLGGSARAPAPQAKCIEQPLRPSGSLRPAKASCEAK